MGTVISGAGGKAAKARAAATRTNGFLSFSRATSFSVVSRRSSLSSGWTRARAQRLAVLSMRSSLLALARTVASASLGICPVRRARTWRPCAACSSLSRAAICGTAGAAASPNAPSVSTASRRISGFLSFSFSVIAGIASLAAGPMSRRMSRAQKAALSSFRASISAGHGLDAALRDGVQNPPADGRIGILQQLGANRDHHLRAGVNGHDGPHGGAADGLVGVFHQLGQGRHGILGGGADRAQGQRRMGADLGRLVFEQLFDRLDGLGRLSAAARPIRRASFTLSASLSDFGSLATSAATGVSSAYNFAPAQGQKAAGSQNQNHVSCFHAQTPVVDIRG